MGESDSGESVSVLSLLRLIPEPRGRIRGEVVLNGTDITEISELAMQHVRDNDIAMIFQDPMTSLNPVLTIGSQLAEGMQLHLGHIQQKACDRYVERCDLERLPALQPLRRNG